MDGGGMDRSTAGGIDGWREGGMDGSTEGGMEGASDRGGGMEWEAAERRRRTEWEELKAEVVGLAMEAADQGATPPVGVWGMLA